MALTLHAHPLSSFCWKALIALYETGAPFTLEPVNLSDPASPFFALWPLGKMPVLVDGDQVVPESSLIVEHLDRRHPGPVTLLPADPDQAHEARLWDRVIDAYVHLPMQKIVADRLRPEADRDPYGVDEARAQLRKAYDLLETRLAGRDRSAWMAGGFGLADLAAAPALFYAGIVEPFTEGRPSLGAYFERLLARPSFQRVLAEARPWFQYYPYREAMPARFLAEAPSDA